MKNIINFSLLLIGIFFFNRSFSQMQVQARVYLAGAFENFNDQFSAEGKPLMRDRLRVNPFNGQRSIPDNDPYFYPMQNFNISQFYTHIETAPNQTLHNIANPTVVFAVTGQNAIVDWVHVQLRSPSDSTHILASRSGLLQRDGDIVDLDGISPLNFENVQLEHYYVVVKHRSHLGVMSKIVNYGDLVDFTNPQIPTYDFGTTLQFFDYTGLAQNTFSINESEYNCMYLGDVNHDGKVKFHGINTDTDVLYGDILNHPSNTNIKSNFDSAIGYYNSDIDMNGKAKFDNPNDDTNTLFSQILFHPGNQYLNSNYAWTIEQIPVGD